MTTSSSFDAVIFDCDGVLVASERLINDIEAGLFSRLGLPLSAEEARARFKGHTVGEIVRTVEALLRDHLSPDWLYDWGMHTALGFVRGLQAAPGVREVLDLLSHLEIPVGVASQAPLVRVELALAITGLAPYFDDRVFSAAMVPRPKPSPDLFLFAAARMGVEPGRCAVIEDSPSGVTAAAAAGMAVFGYAADEDSVALATAGATIFNDMRELPPLLRSRSDRALTDTPNHHCGRLRETYSHLAAGDLDRVAQFFSDDVVYYLPGNHLGGGTLRGRKEVLARIAKGALACDASPATRLTSVVAAGDLVLSVERFSARRHGRVLDQELCVVWHMVAERCVEMWARFADQRACDLFWKGL